MRPKFDASAVWNKLLNIRIPVENRITLFMAVPTIYAKLIEEYENKFSGNPQLRNYVKSVCIENIRYGS